MRHRSGTVRLTIITRNCVDIVNDWVMQNRSELRDHNVVIEAIIANGPLGEKDVQIVREGEDLKHIDYVGLGQLREKDKKKFMTSDSIYIGDDEDERLRPYVQEFVRVSVG